MDTTTGFALHPLQCETRAAAAPEKHRAGGKGWTDRGRENEERQEVDILRRLLIFTHHNHHNR